MTSIRRWMTDPALLGNTFAASSWDQWRALLAGFDGLQLSAAESEVFRALTDRPPPPAPLDELWLVIGRRGGKSISAALLAVVAACTFDRQNLLAPGEIATVMVIAEDRKQARAVYRYVAGLLRSNSMLERLIAKESADAIELTNRVAIEIHTASFRAVRGYTLLAAILDEIAIWYSDGANPDAEILAALRPGLGTLGGRLIALSSPYARRGVLWETYRRHYGREGQILVARAPTRVLNPTFPRRLIDEALEADEPRARAEYLAEFRTDVETFVSREVVEACVAPGRVELPPLSGIRYQAFVDPSGGSGDAFTLAVAHREADQIVIDALRERRPPFSPEAVVGEYAELLRAYRVARVTGDRYAGEWPREQFRKRGIAYEASRHVKNDLYVGLLPRLNSATVTLVDDQVLQRQLVALERRTSRGGRDSIDHPPNGHDDVANAVAGVVSMLSRPRPRWGVASLKPDEREGAVNWFPASGRP
ncbi:MAG: hypothetical protein ACOC9E_00855 [Chloroflexota bacterium]